MSRGSKGWIYFTNAMPLFDFSTTLVAELIAIRENIRTNITRGYTRIVVESGSLVSINYLKDGLGCMVIEGLFIDEIIQIFDG